MCDPVIAGGAMLAMSGIQAYTQYQQGKYASKVAEANADIATAQANDAINRGNAEAEQRRRAGDVVNQCSQFGKWAIDIKSIFIEIPE